MSTIPASFLSGPNAPFIEELYAKYLESPSSVDPSVERPSSQREPTDHPG